MTFFMFIQIVIFLSVHDWTVKSTFCLVNVPLFTSAEKHCVLYNSVQDNFDYLRKKKRKKNKTEKVARRSCRSSDDIFIHRVCAHIPWQNLSQTDRNAWAFLLDVKMTRQTLQLQQY